jgi:hypothetical protein
MIPFYFSLLLFSCATSSLVTTILDIPAQARNNGFRKFVHNQLANWMSTNGYQECFVTEGIRIGGPFSYSGPFYCHLNPKVEGNYQFIPLLDFGRIKKFEHLVPGNEGQEKEIRGMLTELIYKEIFESSHYIKIRNVVVNQKNFGPFVLDEKCYEL